MILKQSVTYARKFLMVLASDHISPATGLVPVVLLSKGVSGAFASAAGAVTEIAHGWYQILLSVADTNTLGDLAYNITVATADPTDFKDEVQAQLFSDLQINASGRALIANNLQQNTALSGFPFPMTSASTGQRQTGLSVTAQRSLSGAGFAPAFSTVSEIGTTGIYTLNLAASDLNSGTVALLLTAAGANDLLIPIVPTP